MYTPGIVPFDPTMATPQSPSKMSAPIDPARVRQLFADPQRVMPSDFLRREIAGRMFERLALVKNAPQQVLDAGCGAGADLAPLQKAYPAAQVLGVDAVPAMLAAAGAGAQAPRSFLSRLLPAKSGIDLLCADLGSCRWVRTRSTSCGPTWHCTGIPQPDRVFAEWRRVLRVEGLLMFSNFGPDTFRELRNAFAAMDETPHTLPFVDMHDFGDQLVEAGFATPVMDMERSPSPMTPRRRCCTTSAPSAAIRWPRAAAA